MNQALFPLSMNLALAGRPESTLKMSLMENCCATVGVHEMPSAKAIAFWRHHSGHQRLFGTGKWGHLLTPRLGSSRGFVGKRQSDLAIDEDQRLMIVKGMRGAVRYGTAETAGLYKLPTYIFGKTGTATQLDGFRSQGWFIGFASRQERQAILKPSLKG